MRHQQLERLKSTVLGLEGASGETEGVRITIGPTKRTYVNPLTIAHTVGEKTHRLPTNIERDIGQKLYVIDCVFVARELTLELVGSNAKSAAANLEAKLVGTVKANQMLRVNSKLTVTGSNRTPFAFTCLRIQTDQDGHIDKVILGDTIPRLNATPVDSLISVAHVNLGDAHELFAFDN